MRKQFVKTIAPLIFLLLSSPMPLRGQSDQMPSSAIDQTEQKVRMSIAKYPLISEIRGNLITIDQGEDYWIPEGQIIEIWRFNPIPMVNTLANQVGHICR
jgi:hypothetical protein